MELSNDNLKPIIDNILGYYFNSNTRIKYNRAMQNAMINQNKGITNACSCIINASEDKEKLTEYVRQRIKEINQGPAEDVDV